MSAKCIVTSRHEVHARQMRKWLSLSRHVSRRCSSGSSNATNWSKRIFSRPINSTILKPVLVVRVLDCSALRVFSANARSSPGASAEFSPNYQCDGDIASSWAALVVKSRKDASKRQSAITILAALRKRRITSGRGRLRVFTAFRIRCRRNRCN